MDSLTQLTSLTSAAVGLPKSMGTSTRSGNWSVDFDELLRDRAGLATFTEFLRKSFCEENIKFYVKVEKYKKLPDDQRKVKAFEIYHEHLDTSAQEQVNVDEDTRLSVEREVISYGRSIFDPAQKHIYLLMKEDCYRRFVTSDLYKQAVLAESEQRPFPFSGEEVTRNEAVMKKSRTSIGDKKSTETKRKQSVDPLERTETRRRTSCIPIPTRSSNKNKEAKRQSLMAQNIDTVQHLSVSSKENTSVTNVEKVKLSGDTGRKGLFGFFRRTSLGGQPSRGAKSSAEHHASVLMSTSHVTATVTTTHLATSLVTNSNVLKLSKSASVHGCNSKRTSIPEEVQPITPKMLKLDAQARYGHYATSDAVNHVQSITFHDAIQDLIKDENWNGEIPNYFEEDDLDVNVPCSEMVRRRTKGCSLARVLSSHEAAVEYFSNTNNTPADKPMSKKSTKVSEACRNKCTPLLGRKSDSASKSLKTKKCDRRSIDSVAPTIVQVEVDHRPRRGEDKDSTLSSKIGCSSMTSWME